MITLAGPGVLYGTRTDAAGTTPCNFGKVKSISLDIDFTVKELTGQFQFPIDFARGVGKIAGKAKLAAISPLALMNLFWGIASATGETLTQFLEAGVIAGASPYTYTVANAANFGAPLEVLYAATGLPFTQVASAPAQGQYVNSGAGVLTFAVADKSTAILVSYTYSGTGGYNLTVNNQLQGFTPSFSAVVYNTKNGKPVTYTLPFCTASKLGRDFKESDFMNPELDFMVGANAAGQVIVENYPELS
jgi:hypothetical protein